MKRVAETSEPTTRSILVPMTLRPLALLLTLVTLACLVPAAAGAQGRVSIENLTIDGDPPPDEYRTVLANGLRPSLESIRDCYSTRLSARADIGGDYALRMWVSNREVIRITPESHVGDDALEECTRTAIYAFRLPPEAPAGGAWVRMTVRFVAPAPGTVLAPPAAGSGTAPSPTPASPPAAGSTTGSGGTTGTGTMGSTTVPGSLSDLMTALPGGASLPTVTIDSVSGAMERARFEGAIPVPALAVCADGTAGSLPVRVSVDAAGAIRARAGRGMAAGVRRCVVSALQAMTLPAGSGPTRARLTVTFAARTP